ncbi:MAG: twin-arginine translocation signal domain-containing protein [Armatimonadia bacterium]|nr:twin-arginine translocation signal domain-containing protein [Armatimonadia bacterium]
MLNRVRRRSTDRRHRTCKCSTLQSRKIQEGSVVDRREFIKMLGAGGALIGLGALVGTGCAEEEEQPADDLPPDPPPDPDAAQGGPGGEGGEAPEDE